MFNSCGKSRKYPAQVWVPMTVEAYMYFWRVFFPGRFFLDQVAQYRKPVS